MQCATIKSSFYFKKYLKMQKKKIKVAMNKQRKKKERESR